MGTAGERDQNKPPDEISIEQMFASFGIRDAEEMNPMFMEYLNLLRSGKTIKEIADTLISSDHCKESYILFYAMLGLAHVLDAYMKNINGVSVIESMKEATEMLNVKKLTN
jgi:hypothetical protein